MKSKKLIIGTASILSTIILAAICSTPTGKRYHFLTSCGGKNSKATTLSDAKSRGLTPCNKCAK